MPAMILETIDVLGPGLISFLLSFFSEEKENSEKAFLESSAAETLLEEYLTVQQTSEQPLG